MMSALTTEELMRLCDEVAAEINKEFAKGDYGKPIVMSPGYMPPPASYQYMRCSASQEMPGSCPICDAMKMEMVKSRPINVSKEQAAEFPKFYEGQKVVMQQEPDPYWKLSARASIDDDDEDEDEFNYDFDDEEDDDLDDEEDAVSGVPPIFASLDEPKKYTGADATVTIGGKKIGSYGPPEDQDTIHIEMAASLGSSTTKFPRMITKSDRPCYVCGRSRGIVVAVLERSETDKLPCCDHCAENVLGYDLQEDGHLVPKPPDPNKI